MENEVGALEGAGSRMAHVPLGPAQGEDVVIREDFTQRGAELAARAGYEDAAASRSERIGDRVLQRPRTRSSSQRMPCSSGSAGSYSSVVW